MAKKIHDDRTLSLWNEDDLPGLPPPDDFRPARTKVVGKPVAKRKRIQVYDAVLKAVWGSLAMLLALVLVVQVITFDRHLSADRRFQLTLPVAIGMDSPNVEFSGIVHASKREMMTRLEPDLGRSVYLIPLRQRRAELASLPWVKDVSLQRLWPNRLRVTVTERKPVAFVRLNARRGAGPIGLVDADGYLLPMPESAKFDLPVLVNVEPDLTPAQMKGQVVRAQEFLAKVGPLAAQVSEIDASDPRDLKVMRAAGNTAVVLRLGSENYQSRLQHFEQNYNQIAEQDPAAKMFDLRLDGTITSARETSSNREGWIGR